MRKLGVRERWAVPVGAVAVVGVVAVASTVASANSAPSLPPRSAAQLLAEVVQAAQRPLGPLTATVQQTSNLGLPALPSVGSGAGNGPFGAQSGTGTTTIWYLNPQHVRVAVTTPMRETDLRLDGRTLWLWNSKTQTATKVALPARFSGINGNVPVPVPAPSTTKSPAKKALTPPTPLAAAQQLLTALGPTTIVRVRRDVTVAGRSAYQLSLAPKSSGSLVGQVLIAIDATKHIPLRLEVIPRGSSNPAYQIGFTSLKFGPPAASNFTFTPPHGAKVKTETVPSALPSGAAGLGLQALLGGALGLPAGWTGYSPLTTSPTLAIPKQVLKQMRAQMLANLPKNLTKAQRAALIKSITLQLSASGSAVSSRGFTSMLPATVLPAGSTMLPSGSTGKPATVIGTGWLSVVATAPNPALAALMSQVTGQASTTARQSVTNSPQPGAYGSSVVYSVSPSVTSKLAGPTGLNPAVLRALLKAMTPVHGSFGTGRLLRTSLLSVLITSNGRVLVGAVTPKVLTADAALPVK